MISPSLASKAWKSSAFQVGLATVICFGCVSLALGQQPPSERPVGDASPIPTNEQADVTRLVAAGINTQLAETRLKAVLRDRLQVSDQGNQRVYRLAKDRRVIATLIFHERQDGVLVRAQPRIIQQLDVLLRSLAKRPTRDRRMAVISIERSEPQKVRRAIDAIRSQPGAQSESSPSTNDRSDVRRHNNGLALVNFVFQDAAGQATDAANADAAADEETNEGGTVGQNAVDVDIQTLPDLDVIILEGRDRDVEQLRSIIEELERLSRETQPQVTIHTLNHANAAAVTEILNQVNEDLTGRRQGRITVTALVKPNAILLIGWGEAVTAMRQLIDELDTPVAADSLFRVYRLRHAPATSVSQSIEQFFSRANNAGLSPRVQSLADPRSNSVIVSGAPRDLAEVDRLVRSLDTAESESVSRAKVVEIRHALATDIAETLRTAIQSTGVNDAPTSILELLTIDSEGERIVRSGILADVRITPNVRNNTLIISGPRSSLPLLESLIRQLDVPGAVSQIKVFRITNGDAASLARMLRSLLPTDSGAAATPRLPTAEGESSLAPLRFSVDNRTNSIIATGSDGDLRIIEALLLRLDERDLAERKTEVYRLRNAPALDVAQAINEFLRSERIVLQAGEGPGSAFEQIEREVVVVPEPIGNSLIISATQRYFNDISDLVNKLDEQPPQVMIQVLIAEVTLNDAHEFGVELGLQDSVLFDRSLLGELVTTVNTTQTSTPAGIVTNTQEVIQAATNQPGFDFNNQPLGNSGSTRALQNSDAVGGQGLSHFAVGRVNNELGFGGLVLSASSESVSVLVRALQESRRLDILSRPQVRTLDNQSAFIQVGQRVPRIVASNITDGGLQTNQVELENVGLIMGVTPRISPDGTVVMEIDAEKSSLGQEQDGIPITVSVDGTVIRSPRIDTTTAQATVSAANGETIILGGLITKSTQAINRSVPYLSEVPLLGDLFRYDSMMHRRTELLIILTPHIIRSPADSERIKQMELARMSWCAADVYEIHGDINAPLHLETSFEEPTQVIYPHVDPRGEGLAPPEPMESLLETEEPSFVD